MKTYTLDDMKFREEIRSKFEKSLKEVMQKITDIESLPPGDCSPELFKEHEILCLEAWNINACLEWLNDMEKLIDRRSK